MNSTGRRSGRRQRKLGCTWDKVGVLKHWRAAGLLAANRPRRWDADWPDHLCRKVTRVVYFPKNEALLIDA